MEAEHARAAVVALGPARVFRELLYRPGGPLSSWVDARFQVLARPGEPPSASPAPGDLLVRVALGEPGAGQVSVLSGAAGTPHQGGDGGRFLDGSGRMPRGQLLLRARPGPAGDLDGQAAAEAEDATTDLGRELVRRFPVGVQVAVYDPETSELQRRAAEWARREEAVGATGTTIDAARLALGVAMSDARGLVRTLTELSRALAQATGATTGPALIRTLALFAHGWGTTLAIGAGLTAGNVVDVVGRMAPSLTNDVTIVLYGCSVCAQADEGDWVATTMRPGGVDSLCGKIRDALVDAGKHSATVWGHTEIGHTTRNWSLRRFRAIPFVGGQDRPGDAYAGEIVFGPEKAGALAKVEAAINVGGLRVAAARRPEFEVFVLARMERHMYRAYGQANRTKTHGGANLAERAPLFPDEVAEIIRTHWRDTYWVSQRIRPFAAALAPQLRSLKILEPGAPGGGTPAAPGTNPSGPPAEEWAEAVEALEESSTTPTPPAGLSLIEHYHYPSVAYTAPVRMEAADMNPGFVDANDDIALDRGPNGLQTLLEAMVTTKYSSLLGNPGSGQASAGDNVRLALVDLTRGKPELAGWGSTMPMNGASLVKIAALYAVHQLRLDLERQSVVESLSKKADLLAAAKRRWTAAGLVGHPRAELLFTFAETGSNPVAVSFSTQLKRTLRQTYASSKNCAATRLILQVGFGYVGSVLWQSGLRHPTRGGLWLGSGYDCCAGTRQWANPLSDQLVSCTVKTRQGDKTIAGGRVRWKGNPMRSPAPVFGHNATALSAAAFFTLMSQGRLVDARSSTRMIKTLGTACTCFGVDLPGVVGTPPSKCGVVDDVKHDVILIDRGRFRYVAVALTQGGQPDSLFPRLLTDLDGLIVRRNP